MTAISDCTIREYEPNILCLTKYIAELLLQVATGWRLQLLMSDLTNVRQVWRLS